MKPRQFVKAERANYFTRDTSDGKGLVRATRSALRR